MPPGAPIAFDSPRLLAIAMTLALLAIAIGLRRRLRMPRWSVICALLGVLCLAIAAGRPMGLWPRERSVVVMVDLSASTRGAGFRDSATLAGRIREIMGTARFHELKGQEIKGTVPFSLRLVGFAGEQRAISLDSRLEEMAAEATNYAPPPADAIVLFSDGQFDVSRSRWSAMPPTYVLVDSGLENIADARVDHLQIDRHKLSATMIDTGAPRVATFRGVAGPTTAPVSAGQIIVSSPLQDGIASAGVELNPGDLWPENDAMSIPVARAYASEQWWIGAAAPALPGWRWIKPDQLPVDAAQFLAPAVIVLNNVAAANLGDSAMDRLTQYVRDLGGSLLILGGAQSFAAGGYPGTALEMLSPLSSAPPNPSTRWVLLADASGSMADDAGGVSRFAAARGAIARLLRQLPPNDPVAVGQFSDQLRWWSTDKSAAATGKLALPPADAAPRGPTNLEAALNRIAADADAALPTELVVLSDCDARIDNPRQVIDAFGAKKIHLHVVALARGSGLEAIRQLAQASGGTLAEQFDPAKWMEAARQLTQAALPWRLVTSPASARFENEAASIGTQTALPWDRVWLKPEGRIWAQTIDQTPAAPMAARWSVGRGQVAAVAFGPTERVSDAIAHLIAQKPRDPRFAVSWESQKTLRVSIDALDQGKYLNGLKFSLEIAPTLAQATGANANNQVINVPQTAPGRYAVEIPAPRQASIVTLSGPNGQIVDRVALAGRYAPEFDALGNNHQNLRELADRTGGALIGPADHRAIAFNWPRETVELSSWFSAAGVLLLLIALVRSRVAW